MGLDFDFKSNMEAAINKQLLNAVNALSFLAEGVVNDARTDDGKKPPTKLFYKVNLKDRGKKIGDFRGFAGNKPDYADQTANLRSSIGYTIFFDEATYNSNFDGTSDGNSAGKKAAVNTLNGKGIMLNIVAGMEYAAALEANGWHVLSAYLPNKSTIDRVIKNALSV